MDFIETVTGAGVFMSPCHVTGLGMDLESCPFIWEMPQCSHKWAFLPWPPSLLCKCWNPPFPSSQVGTASAGCRQHPPLPPTPPRLLPSPQPLRSPGLPFFTSSPLTPLWGQSKPAKIPATFKFPLPQRLLFGGRGQLLVGSRQGKWWNCTLAPSFRIVSVLRSFWSY